jgi:hypothetical protein
MLDKQELGLLIVLRVIQFTMIQSTGQFCHKDGVDIAIG